MELITTFSTAYSAAKGIMDIGKGLLSAIIDAEVKDRFRELLDKVGTFQEALFFLREELLRLQQDKVDLKSKISDLQSKLKQRSKVQYIRPSYWVVDGENKDGPFCQKCYDVDERLVRLYDFETDAWECKECHSKYFGRYFRDPVIGSDYE